MKYEEICACGGSLRMEVPAGASFGYGELEKRAGEWRTTHNCSLRILVTDGDQANEEKDN